MSAALGDRVRPSDLVSMALLAATVAASVLAYDAVPARVVVHYTPEWGVYYGPETLPKAVGLFVLPAVGIVVFALLQALPLFDDVEEAISEVRPLYQALVVLTVLALAAGQAWILLANL